MKTQIKLNFRRKRVYGDNFTIWLKWFNTEPA